MAQEQKVHVTNTWAVKDGTPYLVYWMIGLGALLAKPEGFGFWKAILTFAFWPVQLGYYLAQKGVL